MASPVLQARAEPTGGPTQATNDTTPTTKALAPPSSTPTDPTLLPLTLTAPSVQGPAAATGGVTNETSAGTSSSSNANDGWQPQRGGGRGRGVRSRQNYAHTNRGLLTLFVCDLHDVIYCQQCCHYESGNKYWARHADQ